MLLDLFRIAKPQEIWNAVADQSNFLCDMNLKQLPLMSRNNEGLTIRPTIMTRARGGHASSLTVKLAEGGGDIVDRTDIVSSFPPCE